MFEDKYTLNLENFQEFSAKKCKTLSISLYHVIIVLRK